MKSILLKVPRVIGGVVRYPVEGVITATDQEAENAIADKAAEDATEQGDKALKDHTVDELKDIAAAEEIDLAGASKKADIVAAIEKAREAKAAEAAEA